MREPPADQAYRVSLTSAGSPTSSREPELSVIDNVQAQIWQGIEQQVRRTVRTLVEGAVPAEATA
jgi:hypothetical protein